MSSNNIEFKAIPGQFNIDEAQGVVECFVAGIGNRDSVGDVLIPGAFTESLKRRKPRVVWGHNWNDPIGKVLEIYEVGPGDTRLPQKMKSAGIGGLYARVQFNLNSEKGKEAFANIAFFGQEQEWSIGYKTLDSIHDPALQANILKEVELYEVSPVLHGANQLTGTISVKSDETSEKHGPGMMEMGYGRPESPMMPTRIVVVGERDEDDEDENKPIFSEGLSQPIGGERRERLVAELQSRSGSPIQVLKATENTVLFSRMTGDGRSTMYRISYHTPDNYVTFMFGKPELANGQTTGPRTVVPSQMPSMPMQIKPQANAHTDDGAQISNFGAVMPKGDSYEKTAFDMELSQLEEMISEEFDVKAGRVLNSRNLTKLKNVMQSLQEIIAASEKEVDTKSELIIPVSIENAFHTKQLLDPIFDYHRVESTVTEDGILITSNVSNDFIEAIDTAVKALGGNLGGGIKKGRVAARSAAQAFDPNAIDGDNDGLVQEGSAFERPATPGTPKGKKPKQGLQSTSGLGDDHSDGFDSVDKLRDYVKDTIAEADKTGNHDEAVYNLNYAILGTTKRIPSYKKDFKTSEEVDEWEKEALSITSEMEKIPGFDKGEWSRWASGQVRATAKADRNDIASGRTGLASTSGRGRSDSGFSTLNSDVLNFRMRGNTLAEAAEKFGMSENDIRKGEVAEMARLRKDGTDKDVLAYRLNGLSLDESAKLFGTTPEKLRQREAKEMARLRSSATDKDILDYRSMGVSLEDMAKILNTTPQKIRQREIIAAKDPKNVMPGAMKPDRDLTDAEIGQMADRRGLRSESSKKPNYSKEIDKFISAETMEEMPDFAKNAVSMVIFDRGKYPDTDSPEYEAFRDAFDLSLSENDMNLNVDDKLIGYTEASRSENLRGTSSQPKQQEEMLARAFNKPEVVEAYKKAVAADILKESEDEASLVLEDFGDKYPSLEEKKRVADAFGLEVPEGSKEPVNPETVARDKERAQREIKELLDMIEKPDEFAKHSKFTEGKDLEYIEQTLYEIAQMDPSVDTDNLIKQVGDALVAASNVDSENPEATKLVESVSNDFKKLVATGEGVWRKTPLSETLRESAKSSDNNRGMTGEGLIARQDEMVDMKARGMSMDQIAKEFPTLSRTQISYDISAGEKRKRTDSIGGNKPYVIELTNEEVYELVGDLEAMGLDDIAKKLTDAAPNKEGDNSKISLSPKEVNDYKAQIQEWADSQTGIEANLAGDILEVLDRVKDSPDRKMTSPNVETNVSKAGKSINTHEKLEFELSDDEVGLLTEEMDLYLRTEPENAKLKALKEKLTDSKNGKFSMTSDEAEEFTTELERIDKENNFIGQDMYGVIGQAADSKDGKLSTVGEKRGKLASANNFNNGAPADITEAMQKEFIFWAKRNMNLRLASQWAKKFDENDGKLESREWRSLETLYNNLSPRGKRGGSGRGAFLSASVTNDSAEGESIGRSRGAVGMSAGGLGDIGLRGSEESGDGRGRPMTSGTVGEEKFVGKKFEEVKPADWEKMDNGDQQEWLLYQGSPAKSGMREVDYNRILNETLAEGDRLERRGKIRRASQEPKDIEVDKGPSNEGSEGISKETAERLDSLDKTVGDFKAQYSSTQDSSKLSPRTGLASERGRTSITDEATYFRDVEQSLSKEIQKAREARNKKEEEGLSLLQSLIRKQEASKLGDRRTNVGSIYFTADDADKIMDALMSAIDRQVEINGQKRIEMYAKLIEMIAKSAMSTFVDKDTAEIGKRKTTRVNEAGRTVEINNPNL